MKLLILLFTLSIAMFGQGHSNVLTWNWAQGTGDPAQGYHVMKAQVSGGPYVLIGTVTPSSIKTFTDLNVVSGQTSYYVVTAFNTGGDSTLSNQVTCVTPFQVPSAPTGLLGTSK